MSLVMLFVLLLLNCYTAVHEIFAMDQFCDWPGVNVSIAAWQVRYDKFVLWGIGLPVLPALLIRKTRDKIG